MYSLEQLCRQKLEISESVSMYKILNFASKNDYKSIRLFPLVNFENKGIHSMNQMRNGMTFTVLFYKKMKGIFGPYYQVYCKREDDEYFIVNSNKKLNEHLDYFDDSKFCKKEVDDNLFTPLLKIRFTPISDEYFAPKGICYKDIVIHETAYPRKPVPFREWSFEEHYRR